MENRISITAPEIDAKLLGEPVSIKAMTGKNLNGVKTDLDCGCPCDILLIQINWNDMEDVTIFYSVHKNEFLTKLAEKMIFSSKTWNKSKRN